MNVGKLLFLLFLTLSASGCSSQKKLPYTPLEFPKYEWNFGKDGEVDVVYDVNKFGRVEKVRFTHSTPGVLFTSYLKRKMLEDWRFETDSPQKDVSVKIKFNH